MILEYAIYHSPIVFVRTLLELGADPNYGDNTGFPSLLAALSSQRPETDEISELLLRFGADVQQRSVNDYTPLHLAAAINDANLVRILLSHGADTNARTRIDDFHNAIGGSGETIIARRCQDSPGDQRAPLTCKVWAQCLSVAFSTERG